MVLAQAEFKARWYVLRSLEHNDREIQALDPVGMRHLFHLYLGRNTEKFSSFTPQRKAAITAFTEIKFVNPEFYRL